jgi:excinuclease ABC subunit B
LEHGIVPTPLKKSTEKILESTKVADGDNDVDYSIDTSKSIAADPVIQYMSNEQLERTIEKTRKQMAKSAKDLDFIEAARLRDELQALELKLKDKNN